MIKEIRNIFSTILKRIELKKINFLNHKFKKYIVKFEEEDNNLKIYNSNGDYKIVENNILNKVKAMEIINVHNKEIDEKINYYDNKKEDYKFIILLNSLILLFFGFFFIISFFLGNYVIFFFILLSYILSFIISSIYFYNIMLFREEVKRLKYIKEDKLVYDDYEIINLFKDVFNYIKLSFKECLLRISNLFERRSKI